jgi:type IV secretion system protein TrbI
MTDATISDAPRPAPKLDPEALAIRQRPMRAIKFKRGVIIGGAALGSISLAAVTFFALQPQVFRTVAVGEELSEPSTRGSADALGDLPRSYGDVPQLGPPLPGDLGRPILEHQRAMASEDGGGGATSDPAAEAARAERERRLAELRAARESGVLFQTNGRTAARPAPSITSDPVAQSVEPAPATARPSRTVEFTRTLDGSGDANPHVLTPPASPYTLAAGSVIAASLITGLNSDLPGLVTAQVTQNVYDSATGRILLVPQGARLMGNYDSVVAFGQRRALIVWQRLILPDGSSLRIDNAPATDAAGYAGLEDRVDFHTWSLLRGIGLATLLGVGTELSIGGESDLVRAIRGATQQNAARAGDQIVQRNLDIQPTITIRPGAPVRLVVHKDLILAPWGGGGR